ncbi:MAG: hypothetical protein A3G24_14430 [Betaproteobacteria bacterium RIFCSPLOWO2_12_FULL_62_13]|nr:MAG: hypothetical protein A3G24_14430 [Betaproteobacteria bacterium RIFCSPLOWO2_12_FULL_62_13]
MHRYAAWEIHKVVQALFRQFRSDWFPLANNVERMYRGTEKPGLGSIIYQISRSGTLHAQGASYLGVILEEAGLLEWNGRARGIAWRFVSSPPGDEKALYQRLSNAAGRVKRRGQRGAQRTHRA